jgi:ferric-dicitrate binding protein FerR (iron transport regulator)
MDQLIIRYLDGSASENDMRALLDWLHENGDNRNYFHDYRHIWLSSGKLQASPTDVTEAFLRFKKTALRHETARQNTRMRLRYLLVAASILILIVCSRGAYLLGTKKTGGGDALVNQTVVRDTKSSVTLPDGSLAWLNTNSKITYPGKFDPKERKVKVEGEVFLEVRHKDGIPFVVETGRMRVHVSGTEFSVKNYPGKDESEVVLLSGKVDVLLLDRDTVLSLSPGQRLSLNKKTEAYNLEKTDASLYTLWKNERLVMDNEKLETIFRKMEHWYGINIICKENLPLASKYSITITDEPKEEIFRLLSILTPIKYKIENEKVTIMK